MAFIDYYKILGVDKSIPQKDVKKAYLKRAMRRHQRPEALSQNSSTRLCQRS